MTLRSATFLAACWLLSTLAPPRAIGSEAEAPLWVDVSDAVGLTFEHRHGGSGERFLPETMGAGGCVLDANGDGRMDLFLVQSGSFEAGGRHGLFLQTETGSFSDRSNLLGPLRKGSYGQGAACADYDGDGDTDIYVTALGPNLLLRNDGDAFRQVGAEAGVADPGWGSSAVFFDADGDRDLDLYVVRYLEWSLSTRRSCRIQRLEVSQYCHPDVYPAAQDRFFSNQGDGTFLEGSAQAGFDGRGGKGLGAIATDFDADGRVDLYVTNDSTPNFLYRNLGRGRFEEIGLQMGAAFNDSGKTEAGMGVAAGDVDGDGWTDLFVTNLSLETNSLYLGGEQGFDDATQRAGLHAPSLRVLGFGTHLTDLDRDMDLDLIVINGDVLDNIHLSNDALSWRQPGQVLLNNGRGRFSLVEAARLGGLATPRVGRGSMLADFDDDGRSDLAVSYNNDRARIYRNLGPEAHWIGFRLMGRGPNTAALGARLVVEAGGRAQAREARAGSSYQSSSDPRLLFGLGTAEKVDRVTLTWPGGERQVLRDLSLDQYHLLTEPEPVREGVD